MTDKTVLHYRVGDLLGSGGMGEVYRAEDTRLGRPVALKFLREGSASTAERARLLREARAASALRSSNIAAIYDLGEHEGRPFIVMEFVEGEPLSARIARGPLPVHAAIELAMQAADALDEAHARGILHRDIKSSNLLIDTRGRVKLVDFGLAKFVGASGEEVTKLELETAVGTVLGTFAYMSPEQVRGRPLDARSDLFSLGVVLYEMLTGRLPFEGATITDVIDHILNHEPPAIARFNYDVPDAVETIVRRALAKDPSFRCQSARELYIDLHNAARDLAHAAAANHSRDSFRSEPRHRVSVADAQRRATPANSLAVMTFSNITKEPADDWIGSGIAETVTADLKRIKGLTVIGRAQVFDAIKHLSGSELEHMHAGQAIEIGRRLGARWIVGGAFQRLGPQIRITAEAVDVATGALVKTVKVDGQVQDIFALQDKIVHELTQGVNLKLKHSEIEAIGRDETKSLAAYEAFSRGMMNLRLATRDSLTRAVVQFEQAVSHDPSYAMAWGILATTYNLQGQFLNLPELSHKARHTAQHALSLDPDNVYALTGLGASCVMLDCYDEAIVALRKAVTIDPENVLARGTLARAHFIGKGDLDAAIAELDATLRLNEDAGYVLLQLALLLAIRGDFERAEAAARRAVALQERGESGTEGVLIVGSHVRLGYALYRQGRYDEAIAAYESERAFLAQHDHALKARVLIESAQKLSAAWHRKGNAAEADRWFEDATGAFRDCQSCGADDEFTKYYIASLYALRGDADSAMRHLSASMATHAELKRVRLRLDPDFDPVRDHPQFRALLAA
jgi:serine/threonine protein kinase/tetratricopeptide (TPR) repeat protein